MTRARDLANIADGTFTATDLDLSGTLTVSGDAAFDTNTLFVDVSANAVGIGTTSPNSYASQTTLTINGSTYGRLDLESAGSLRASLFATTGSTTLSAATDILSFDTSGGEAMRITSGNLLVGKSSNAISGQSSSIQSNSIVSTSGPLNSHTSSAGVFEFNTNKVAIRAYGATAGTGHIAFNVGGGGGSPDFEAVRIAESGNLGVGTSSPSQRLSIYKGISYNADSALFSTIEVNDTSVDNNAVYRWRTGITGNATGHSYTFSTQARTQGSYVERARIDSSGNLLVGTTGNPGGRFSLKAGANQHSKVVDSVNVIAGSSESAVMAEGTVAVNTTSLGTVLSIPFYSQGSVWRRYIIEFMFSSGEYNDSGNGKSGTATVRLASLTFLSGVTLLDSTGTVSSVGSSGMNLQITFSSGFTGGLNNHEGVLVYYKVLSSHPSYFQPWNATLN